MTRTTRFILACATALAACGLIAAAAAAKVDPQTQPGDQLDPRTYAPESTPFLSVHAAGVQRYACQTSGVWLFTDPVATLYKTSGNQKATGSHFLNFATGRPVWELRDGSTVEAARKASAPAGTGNIPALLLMAVGRPPAATGSVWPRRRGCSG